MVSFSKDSPSVLGSNVKSVLAKLCVSCVETWSKPGNGAITPNGSFSNILDNGRKKILYSHIIRLVLALEASSVSTWATDASRHEECRDHPLQVR